MRASIAITGLGAVSALGDGVEAIVQAMREGRDALTELERFDLRALAPVRLAGWVAHRRDEDGEASLDAWACDAAREAWRDARGEQAGFAPERIAIVSGTTLGEEGALGLSVDAVAAALGAKGPRWTISTACASSANALGLARDLLLSGDADVVIAGGAEKLVIEIIAGFAALGVLGAGKCAPFGQDVGTTLGEGAGYLVLERDGERNVRPRAYLLGYGLSSDAFHETSPDPRGEGVARAMTGALIDAGVDAARVDYVNAHATGTAANDDAEWRGIQRALGSRAAAIPVSASKGFFGHAQGAAGVLETIATLACMERGLVPPSLRVGRGRPRGPTDTVSETGRAREAPIEIALSNSAAFGGANAVLAIGRHALARPLLAAQSVTIEGVGAVAVAAGAPRDEAALARACGEVELRGTDPSSRYVLGACTLALAEAGMTLRGATRERTGIFGGVGAPPRESVRSYQRSLERGIDRASAPAFARTVAHAPVGAASRLLGAKGPATTVVGDGVGGLLAIAYAARWLATRDDADRLLAGGVDERALDEARDPPLDATDEGAAFVVLARGGRGPRVVGVATSGRADDATARALAAAGVRAADVHAWSRSSHADGAATLASARALARAVSAIREGAPLAVALAEGRQGAVALVLARPRT
jgi:3-oxoacyl-[acyl-carrier-protein] synthase II